MTQGQHRRPSEPLRERLVRWIAPVTQREKPDPDQRTAEDSSPRGRHARAHETAA
ncbi:MAG TPA: hypothetical protein VF053_13780 [Streptosporangiales bacterium]